MEGVGEFGTVTLADVGVWRATTSCGLAPARAEVGRATPIRPEVGGETCVSRVTSLPLAWVVRSEFGRVTAARPEIAVGVETWE